MKKNKIKLLIILIGWMFPIVSFYNELKRYPIKRCIADSIQVVMSNRSFLIVCTAPLVFYLFSIIIDSILTKLENEKKNLVKIITEKQNLSNEVVEKNTFLELILDKSPVSYITVNEEGIVDYLNTATETVYGSLETIGINLFKLEVLKGTKYVDCIKNTLKGSTNYLEKYYHTSISDHVTRIYNISFIPLVIDKKQKKVLIITEDISKEVRLFEEMRRLTIDSFKTMSIMLDAKDQYTRKHSENVLKLVIEIASDLVLTDEELEALVTAAELHDIGKIGVPDAILNKKGKLTEIEFDIMKRHPVIGNEIVSSIDKNGLVCKLIMQHHERYDGNGYPLGLKGNEINNLAQVLAIADVIDALASKRSYKKAYSVDEVFCILETGMGTQFNPKICSKIVSCLKDNLFLETLYSQGENIEVQSTS